MGPSGAQKRIGGRIAPLIAHLRELEDALLSSLRHRHYKGASHSVQLAMRRKGLVPPRTHGVLDQPQVYSTWLRCKRYDILWWDGAMANQPYVLMAEFDVCENIQSQLMNWKNTVQTILGEK